MPIFHDSQSEIDQNTQNPSGSVSQPPVAPPALSLPPKSRDPSPSRNNEQGRSLVKELIRKRGQIKGRLTRFVNYLASIKTSDISTQTRIDLKLRIKGTNNIYSEFSTVQNSIDDLVSESELDAQLNERTSFEDTYYTALSQAELMLEQSSPNSSDNSLNSMSSSGRTCIKLPTIQMPTFDGSYNTWLEFRDKFLSLVHNSNEISNIEKFHYLKSALKGNAELIIDSVEISSQNYMVAWELLLNRFDNNRLLIDNHLRALTSMQPIGKESPSLIRKLSDTILKNLRALQTLNEPIQYWDSFLIHFFVEKLDKTTEREWEQYRGRAFPNFRDHEARPKIEHFLQFLNDEADMLDTLQQSHNNRDSKPQVETKKTKFFAK